VGNLPEQLAALNRTNINVQLLTIQAALTGDRNTVYQAAALDPHTAAELSLDQIRSMCDELIEAHALDDAYPRAQSFAPVWSATEVALA
jgi:alpha-galactosidase